MKSNAYSLIPGASNLTPCLNPSTVVRMGSAVASTETYRWVPPGGKLKCFCDKTLYYMGPHTGAFVRPQLGSTGPSTDADNAIKCDFCGLIVEVTNQRVG